MNTARNILIIGDITKAFLDKALIANNDYCDICQTIPQAIEAVKNNSYSAIAIVMSSKTGGTQPKLIDAIKTLRDNISSLQETRILLLAQMYEEPIAIRLVNSSYNCNHERRLVDDYMICPVDANEFLNCMLGTKSTCHEKTQTKLVSDKKTETSDELQATSDDLSARIRHLEKLATEDDLTGLKNRRYIMEFTRQIIEYAKEENGRATLLVFDIDDFKKYNDNYGHIAGDEILKQAAHLMQRSCRPHDVVGRIGGDEFAVVFWDEPSLLKNVIEHSNKNDRRSIDSDHPNEAMIIAKRFVSELEKAPTLIGNQNKTELGPTGIGTLTISGGLASFPRDGKTAMELFEQADKALLEAKRSGKNRIYLVGKPENS